MLHRRPFHRQVLAGDHRIGRQPVPEQQRPSPIGPVSHPHVQVDTLPGIGVGVQSLHPVGRVVAGRMRGVPLESDRPRKPGCGQGRRQLVGRVQAGHGELQIDDVLGRHPRDRGRTDVIDPGAAGRAGDPGGQPARVGRPPRSRVDQPAGCRVRLAARPWCSPRTAAAGPATARSTASSSSSRSPWLTSMTSHSGARCSSVSCAAIRALASGSARPRVISRCTRSSGFARTPTTR